MHVCVSVQVVGAIKHSPAHSAAAAAAVWLPILPPKPVPSVRECEI